MKTEKRFEAREGIPEVREAIKSNFFLLLSLLHPTRFFSSLERKTILAENYRGGLPAIYLLYSTVLHLLLAFQLNLFVVHQVLFFDWFLSQAGNDLFFGRNKI